MLLSGTDPEFPVGGDANPPVGASTHDFAKFSKKLYEIEKILNIVEIFSDKSFHSEWSYPESHSTKTFTGEQ